MGQTSLPPSVESLVYVEYDEEQCNGFCITEFAEVYVLILTCNRRVGIRVDDIPTDDAHFDCTH